MHRNRIASWLITIGLAAVFAWFGIDKFANPAVWIGWLPRWMDSLLGVSAGTWLQVIGASELLFAIMIVSPIRNLRRAGALLMASQIACILPIAGLNDVGLRDFAMMMSAIALAIML